MLNPHGSHALAPQFCCAAREGARKSVVSRQSARAGSGGESADRHFRTFVLNQRVSPV